MKKRNNLRIDLNPLCEIKAQPWEMGFVLSGVKNDWKVFQFQRLCVPLMTIWQLTDVCKGCPEPERELGQNSKQASRSMLQDSNMFGVLMLQA